MIRKKKRVIRGKRANEEGVYVCTWLTNDAKSDKVERSLFLWSTFEETKSGSISTTKTKKFKECKKSIYLELKNSKN